MSAPRVLHYMAYEPGPLRMRSVPVPSCWDGTWTFSPALLTSNPSRVECKRCLARLTTPVYLSTEESL